MTGSGEGAAGWRRRGAHSWRLARYSQLVGNLECKMHCRAPPKELQGKSGARQRQAVLPASPQSFHSNPYAYLRYYKAGRRKRGLHELLQEGRGACSVLCRLAPLLAIVHEMH